MKRLIKITTYRQILIAQIVLLLLAGAVEKYIIFYGLFALCMLDIFGWIIASVITKRWLRIVSAIAGMTATLSGAFSYIPDINHEPLRILLFVSAFSYAVFALIATLALIKSVFRTEFVKADTVVGSICIYLMIGMFFAFVYAGLTVINPDAFNIQNLGPRSVEHIRDFLYFSYITLSTIGFGDMVPLTSLTKMLAAIEGMIGPVYLAIVVAHLVGLHTVHSTRREHHEHTSQH